MPIRRRATQPASPPWSPCAPPFRQRNGSVSNWREARRWLIHGQNGSSIVLGRMVFGRAKRRALALLPPVRTITTFLYYSDTCLLGVHSSRSISSRAKEVRLSSRDLAAPGYSYRQNRT